MSFPFAARGAAGGGRDRWCLPGSSPQASHATHQECLGSAAGRRLQSCGVPAGECLFWGARSTSGLHARGRRQRRSPLRERDLVNVFGKTTRHRPRLGAAGSDVRGRRARPRTKAAVGCAIFAHGAGNSILGYQLSPPRKQLRENPLARRSLPGLLTQAGLGDVHGDAEVNDPMADLHLSPDLPGALASRSTKE